ncbi:uncharacterized protein PAC_06935 [Phialocephala subalpina]|uniref:Uncharacterized protein n=1 Tax=Phialocephala subalpina TaxID=576137 RepID=A0A1L7WWB2_9HELO|nr:uncharacterized protein PAC_06935 [Phialocephala subalpina]
MVYKTLQFAPPRALARDAQSTNLFTTPPPNTSQTAKDYRQNPIFELGSNLTLTWISNYTTIILDFTQDLFGCIPGRTPCGLTSTLYGTYKKNYLKEKRRGEERSVTDELKIEAASNPGKFEWTVDRHPYNISASNVFYFVMYNRSVSDTSATFMSHYFNITEAAVSVSTSTTSATSTSASSSGLGTTIASTSAATSLAASDSANK